LVTPHAGPFDFTQTSLLQLEVAIAAQKIEIQRLFKAKAFAKMPAAQHVLARLLRAKIDLRQKLKT